MTDNTHLDEVIEAAQTPFEKKLLTEYRDGIRNEAWTAADCVTQLKSVMEESLQEVANAPTPADD